MNDDDYFLETPAPRTSGWLPSDRYYISKTGMPHRSGETGDYGRNDGSHLTAQEMADANRTGRLEQLIRRIQMSRSQRPYIEEAETPVLYDPNMEP